MKNKKNKKNIFKILRILVVCVILFLGCKYIYQEYIAKQTEEVEITKVACVGDSLTFRRSYTEDYYNYPEFLDDLLGESYKVTNYGISSTCVQANSFLPYVDTHAYEVSVEAEADIIIIMLGTNDIWYDRWKGEENFYYYYSELLDSYLKTSNKPEIYLCTVPYFFTAEDSQWYEYDNETRSEINSIISRIAQERGYHLIEMEQITKEHPEWYEWDGLHFNSDGAVGLAEIIYKALKNSR